MANNAVRAHWGSGRFTLLEQTQRAEHPLSVATQEFPADPVTGIRSGFPERDRHLSLPEQQPKGQSGQAASHNVDGRGRLHDPGVRRATK